MQDKSSFFFFCLTAFWFVVCVLYPTLNLDEDLPRWKLVLLKQIMQLIKRFYHSFNIVPVPKVSKYGFWIHVNMSVLPLDII